MITAPHSVSLDGFIADADHRSDRLHAWLRSGGTPSRLNPSFTMPAASAAFFDQGVARCGAVIAGRRTHDVTGAWGGKGPMPGLPLFVLTHRAPDPAPPAEPPYTYVTGGIERAVEQARTAAAGKDVVLMGATVVQQCLRAGLLDELIINLVPIVLGRGVRLLNDLEPVDLELTGVIDAPAVTHLTYRVLK